MWKLIDCGTYLWFVKQASKYFHCIKATSGEHKKIKRNDIRQLLYSGVRRNDSIAVSYLRNWNLETAECIINKNSYKFFHKQWKSYRKTMLMKEILKQLKGVR